MWFPMKIRSSMKNNNSDHKDSHVGPLSQLVLILGYKQGSYASWKPLNFESTLKALKVLENLCYSFLIHESPWIIIDSRFHCLKSPSSRHTYVTICEVENGYQCLCIIFRHVHYRKMSNSRIVRLFSLFIFFEVNKEEVLDISKYGPWVFCLK